MVRPRRIEPGPGQESVWDYPRPPRVERSEQRIVVQHRGAVLADTTEAFRVLETSQPPAFYLPPQHVSWSRLRESAHRSSCEWKGTAHYFDIVVDDEGIENAAWTYPEPRYEEIRGHVAFYPQRLDVCLVDDEQVRSNDGDFYGGWVTSSIVGPFKGAPGTLGW